MQFPGAPMPMTGFPPQQPQAFPTGQMDPAAAQQYAQQYWQYMMYYQQMQQQQAQQMQMMQLQQQQQQQQQAAMMAQHQQQPPHMGGAPAGGAMPGAAPGGGGAAGGAGGVPQPNDQGLYVLFVYHLPHNVTEDMLRSMFGKYGNIAEIVIMRDDNNDPASRTKGYGFVKYPSYQEAAAAVQYLNGAQLENKRLEVSFKLPKGQRRI